MTLVPMTVPGVGEVLLPPGTKFIPISPEALKLSPFSLDDHGFSHPVQVRFEEQDNGLVDAIFKIPDDPGRMQYSVVQEIDGKDPELMPVRRVTLKGALEYKAWIEHRDQQIKVAADTEKAEMDAGRLPRTNENYLRFYLGNSMSAVGRPLKDATYRIVRRTVSEWEPAEA